MGSFSHGAVRVTKEWVHQNIHALCYFCKTWCLGANGVICMIPLVLTPPAFCSGLTMLNQNCLSAVRICLSKCECLVICILDSDLVILAYLSLPMILARERLFPSLYQMALTTGDYSLVTTVSITCNMSL